MQVGSEARKMARLATIALLGLVAVLGVAVLAACTDDGDESQEEIVERLQKNADRFEYDIGSYGGNLAYTTVSEPLTFNLALSNDASSSSVLGYLFEGLTETSWLTDEVEPALAESWESSDDGLTWTFRMRPGVTWHDGQPVTAHDVDFTFNRIIYNEDIPTSARAAFTFRFPAADGGWSEEPMTVAALDDSTVRIVLPSPFAPFLRSMGTAIYPKHILESHVDGGTFADVWDIDTDPTEIIGTGPFTIQSYVPEESIVFRRNAGYWMKDADGNSLPYLDTVTMHFVETLDDELEGFQSGQADVHGVLGEEYATLEPLQEEGNFTIHKRGPGFGTTFLTFNVNPGTNPETGTPLVSPEKLAWFGNAEFRQAAAHSIDKQRIVDETLHGLGYPQWSSISPATGDFHNPDVVKYRFDPNKANDILDDLGWVDTDGDGIREDGGGNAIEFQLTTNGISNEVRGQVTEIIAEGLGNVGIGAMYEPVEFGELVAQLTTTYDWEAIVIGFTGGSDPYGGISFWHSSETLHLWNPNQESPATEWEAEIDSLYVEASQELDHEERVKLYRKAQEVAAENAPIIYTALSERLSAVRNVFGNTTPTLYGLWDVRYLYRTDR